MLSLPFFLFTAIAGTCSFLGCIVPLPGLAAAAALTLEPRRAYGVVFVSWLANQIVGFWFLGYPHVLSTELWGAAIGAAAFVACAVSAGIARRPTPSLSRVFLAGVAGFVAYEGVLVLASIWLGGWEGYSANVVLQLAITNVTWFLVVYLGMSWFARRFSHSAA